MVLSSEISAAVGGGGEPGAGGAAERLLPNTLVAVISTRSVRTPAATAINVSLGILRMRPLKSRHRLPTGIKFALPTTRHQDAKYQLHRYIYTTQDRAMSHRILANRGPVLGCPSARECPL